MARARMQRVRLHSFKMFSGIHEIDLCDREFVCCVGRNGAGKSCIVDAIEFCFGATVHQLRVKKLTDLINDYDKAHYGQSNVSVGVCISAPREDNEVWKCIWIQRETQSEPPASTHSIYYGSEPKMATDWTAIDKTDMWKTLSSYGIDLHARERFIIRQLKTATLAQTDANTLLDFCERVVGTHELKGQAEALEEEIQAFQTQILQIRSEEQLQSQILHKHQPMLSCFERWRKDMEAYEIAKRNTDEKFAETIVSLHSVFTRQKEELASEKKHVEITIVEIRHKEEELRKKVAALDKRYTESESQLDVRKRNARFKSIEKAKVLSEIEALRSEKHHIVKTRGKMKKRLSLLMRERKKQQELLRVREDALNKDKELLNEFLTSCQLGGEYIQITEQKKLQEYVDNEMMTRTRIKEAVDQQRTWIIEIEKQKKKVGHLRVKAEKQQQRSQKLRKESDYSGMKLAFLESKALEIQKKQANIMDCLSRLQQQYNVERAVLENRALNTLSTSIEKLRTTFGSDRVYGSFHSLAFVHPKFSAAVNSVLYPYMNHVLVNSRDTAVTLVTVFTKKKLGNITCCILDEITDRYKQEQETGRLTNFDAESHGVAMLSAAIVCKDARFVPLYERYCLPWLVCDKSEVAMDISGEYNRNCVTYDGDLFFADGTIRTFAKHKLEESMPHIRPIHTVPSGAGYADSSRDGAARGSSDTIKYITRSISEKNDHLSQLEENMTAVIKALFNERSFAAMAVEALVVNLDLERISDASIGGAKEMLKLGEHKQRYFDQVVNRLKQQLTKSPMNEKEIEILKKVSTLCETIRGSEMQLKEAARNINKSNLGIDLNERKMTILERELEESDQFLLLRESNVQKFDCELDKKAIDEMSSELQTLSVIKERVHLDLKKVTMERAQNEIKRTEIGNSFEKLTDKLEDLKTELDDSMHTGLQDRLSQLPSASEKELTKRRLKLKGRLHQLQEDSDVLNVQKEKISLSALQEAKEAKESIDTLQLKLKEKTEQLEQSMHTKSDLMQQRFIKLSNALTTVSSNLCEIYRILQEDGDAYLSYSKEKTTLFKNGITLNCKPDENQWQTFVGLSGGQQVLCTISLILAFQMTFPCPIYICDEMDAALDTYNVHKVARLLHKQSKDSATQFIIVSHRPEMWKECEYFVGVYKREHSAEIIHYEC